MNDFWNQIVFGNPFKKYLGVAVAVLLALALKRLVSRYIAGLLFRPVERLSSGIDKASFVNLIARPISTFILIFISFAALEKLHFPDQLDFDLYEVSSKQIFHAIATCVIMCGLIWLLLRIIDFIAMIVQRRANAVGDIKNNQLIIFFRDFLKVTVGIIGFLLVLNFAFHFDIGRLATGLGLAGAALALAAKESVENLIASFVILFDKPFTAGDVVKVQGITGTIEKIGLRSTRIRTDQKTYVTVPNKQMVDSIVDNLSLRTQRKAEIRLQVALSSSSDTLKSLTDGISKILDKKFVISPTCFLNEIAPNAFLVNVDYFTSPIPLDDFNNYKQQINLEVINLLESLHIEISGASTDVRVSTIQENGETR